LESKGKAWMAASAGMLALAVITATAPMISSAIANRSFTEPYGTIPTQGTCSDKLGVFIHSLRNSNMMFLKNVRDYFEQQTGCLVEQTAHLDSAGGLYANQNFPQIQNFEYAIINAEPLSVGGSFGSIPAWKVRVRYELEIEPLEGWGLCAPDSSQTAVFSGDWQDPAWPAGDAIKWYQGRGEWYPFWAQNYGKNSQYWSRYAVSYERELLVTDQYGPIVDVYALLCGSDQIFQNSTQTGLHSVFANFYLDPADLAPYDIPFYSWMGW
jgi:hypothetical protein